MKFYIEITLLPDIDIDINFLLSKAFMQLHLALVESKRSDNRSDFGVSFPEYEQDDRKNICYLGKKLRVFAHSENELNTLRLSDFFTRLEDYVHLKEIKPVPDYVKCYAFFSRLSRKSSETSLAKRRAKKLNISYEEALIFFKDKVDRQQPRQVAHLYPFISFESLGTGGKYSVMVVKKESEQGLVSGNGFSTYGLSANSSVPIF